MSEESIAHAKMMRISENIHSFLDDRERSGIFLEQHLESLKATHRQQIQTIELQHQADLERRILKNSLLVANTDSCKTNGQKERPSSERNGIKKRESIYKFTKPKRSSSTPDLSISLNKKQSFDTAQSWVTSPAMTRTRGSQNQTLLQVKESNQAISDREAVDLAECHKQVCVTPVPEHVFMSLYDNFVHEKERMREERRKQRKEFLLSMQKPFTFHQREQKKEETAVDKKCENNKHTGRRTAITKAVTDPAISEHLKEEEQKRKIRIQVRAQETLRASSAPVLSQASRADGQQGRTAQRTKSRVLGFLEKKPSFQPKTNAQVPDFDKLYQDFQKKMMETAEKREVTVCQPFQLRTSALQPRPSSSSTEQTLNCTNKESLKRNNFCGGLRSLSMDTLPTYITDAARKRSMAIRKSMELKDSKEQENAEWMKRHRMNAQAISRAVAARAKAMDPHKSLKEVYQEKLKQHRKADQERVKDYKRELKEIKTRVTTRPYLFERVSQKNAKTDAERRYRSTLEQAGLDENFVRSRGENDKIQTSKNEDIDSNSDDQHSSVTEARQGNWEGSGEDSGRHEVGMEVRVKTKEEDFS
ncbi:protein FAM161B isoform X2 [Hoplias malabaricus]|uniref:protein FAM161B isoform X2 n=1 Tax=Hoplias malabaricus TaxID=27720 RepID=UPI00346326E9